MIAHKILLFDLDGTLTDSKQGIINSIRYALSKMNLKENNINLEKFIGPPLAESFEKYFGLDNNTARYAVSVYREYYAVKGIFENRVYPGIPELLHKLKDKKKTLVCVTSKAGYYAQQILDHFNLSQYFTKLVGSNMDLTCTHKIELIRLALSYFPENSNSDFIMIGDRADDIIGAKKNNIKSIGVLYGYGTAEEIKAETPDYIVKSVKELRRTLCGFSLLFFK
ncbi:MAG: HAD hydrolase-like protein [candidate division WOR-3 bacterium]|nr:HAD hydrolase-like protein [candidate division WOR-3 bacterium]